MRNSKRRFITGGVLLGVGLGGFVDGILLHQILQWHHMLSSTGDYPATTIAGLEANTLADGLFHAFSWVATIAGVYLLLPFRREQESGMDVSTFTGLLFIGWGGFNVVEGLVDHQILGIHHVHPSGAIGWDLGFIALGVLLIGVGAAIVQTGDRKPGAVGRPLRN